jgi:hypothetical protein
MQEIAFVNQDILYLMVYVRFAMVLAINVNKILLIVRIVLLVTYLKITDV